MNLPLYSPTAPGGAEARVGQIGGLGPFPDIAEHLAKSASRGCAGAGRTAPARRGKSRCRRRAGGGAFPFRFGRQPRAGPARKGVRFVIADVLDGRRGVQRGEAVEPELARPLAAFAAPPVERRLDRVVASPTPAVRQPQVRFRVAAAVDEGAPFAVGGQAIGQRVRRQPDPMAGTLAVEGETATVMTDVGRPLASLDPGQRSGRGAASGVRATARPQGPTGSARRGEGCR